MTDIVNEALDHHAAAPEAQPDTDGAASPEPDALPASESAGMPHAEAERGVPLAALIEERRKRQALEARLAELDTAHRDARLEQGFYTDPEKYIRGVRESLSGELRQLRMEATEAAARARYADFDEKVTAFTHALAGNHEIARAFMNSGNPAEFAYRVGSDQLVLMGQPPRELTRSLSGAGHAGAGHDEDFTPLEQIIGE